MARTTSKGEIKRFTAYLRRGIEDCGQTNAGLVEQIGLLIADGDPPFDTKTVERLRNGHQTASPEQIWLCSEALRYSGVPWSSGPVGLIAAGLEPMALTIFSSLPWMDLLKGELAEFARLAPFKTFIPALVNAEEWEAIRNSQLTSKETAELRAVVVRRRRYETQRLKNNRTVKAKATPDRPTLVGVDLPTVDELDEWIASARADETRDDTLLKKYIESAYAARAEFLSPLVLRDDRSTQVLHEAWRNLAQEPFKHLPWRLADQIKNLGPTSNRGGLDQVWADFQHFLDAMIKYYPDIDYFLETDPSIFHDLPERSKRENPPHG